MNAVIIDKISAPADVSRLMETIHRAGFEVWLVGGAIRDFLAGYPPHDWDVATNAPCHRLMELFPRLIPIGIHHNIVQIHTGERTVEVNSYEGFGGNGIHRDLARRDFTVNALAASHPSGEVLDPFGGRADLHAGMLRAVGDAHARFQEDQLRTLRACRFVSVYGWTIEPATCEALKRHAHRLQSTAVERIREELFKLLSGVNIAAAFAYMRRGGIIQVILPEMLHGCTEKDGDSKQCIFQHLVATVQHSPNRLRLRLAALFHDIAKPARPAYGKYNQHPSELSKRSGKHACTILTRLKTSRKLTSEVVKLVNWQLSPLSHQWSDADIRRIMAAVGTDFVNDLLDLAHADLLALGAGATQLGEMRMLRSRFEAQIQAGPPLQVKDLAVTGHDLMRSLGLPPGPVLGKILLELLGVVLEDPTRNTFQHLMAHAEKKFVKSATVLR